MKSGYAVCYRATQAEVDAGKFNNIAGARIEIVSANGTKTGTVYESGSQGQSPSQVATSSSVAQAFGGAYEKVTIAASGFALTPSTEGKTRIFHLESGSLKELAVSDWAIPSSPQMFFVQNHTSSAKTFSINTGAGQFSGLVDFDGDEVEDSSFSIKKNTEVKITIDQDGWIQVSASGSTYTKVEIDTALNSKTNTADIVDNLTSTDTGKPLSAKQGKALQDNKEEKTIVATKADDASISRIHGQVFTTSKALCHPVNFAANTATPSGGDGTYTVSASSEHSAPFAGRMVFDGLDTTDWATSAIVANFWVRLQLPVKKIITRIIARGRNSGLERVTSWRIEASNDGTAWTILHSSTTILGNTAQTFDFTNKIAYLYYQLFAVSGEASNPGLSRLEFHEDVPTVPTATTSVAGLMSSTDKTKLDGVATGATANDTDANLKNRANHTGTQAQSTITNLTTDLGLKAPLASPAFTGTPTGITKAHVGLGNCDNTADSSKPISTAQQTALDAKQDDLTAAQIDALNKIQSTATRTIPNFTSATATGTLGTYTITRSSEFSATYAAWKACQASDVGGADNEWATASQLTNLWIAIQLPVAKVVTSIRVRGRTSNEHPQAGWRLEGSNDGASWTTLYTSATAMDMTLQTHQINNTTAYLYYRMFAPTGSGTNPGMRAFWLYENAYSFPAVSV